MRVHNNEHYVRNNERETVCPSSLSRWALLFYTVVNGFILYRFAWNDNCNYLKKLIFIYNKWRKRK